MCRVVAPPHKSFPKVQKIRNITVTSGQAINNICRGAFFMEKYSDNFEENVKYFGELVQPDKNFDMIVKKLK